MSEEVYAKYRMEVARRLELVLQAQAITLRLCRKSGLVEGYRWRETATRQNGSPLTSHFSLSKKPRSFTSHRTPPLPFHSFKHQGSGFCRVCGQPVYGKEGSHLAKFGPSNRTWHDACVTTYTVMTKPNGFSDILILRQKELCAVKATPMEIGYRAEVDHAIPLYRIARDHSDEPWYELLKFWLLPNLQAISRIAHVEKCAAEAKERAGARKSADQGAML